MTLSQTLRLKREAWMVRREAMVEHLPALVERDELLGVTTGAAGCIASLLNLYRCAASDRALAAAIRCGERLLTCAESMDRGKGWITAAAGTKPLFGFSQGAPGMGVGVA